MTVQQNYIPDVMGQSARPSNVIHATFFFIAAALAVFPHFQIGALFGPASYIWLLGITGLSVVMSSELAFALMIVCLFFQNVLLAIVSPDVRVISSFSALLGTSFVISILMAFTSLPVWQKLPRDIGKDNQKLLRGLLLFLVVIVLYTGLGMVAADAKSAITYARTYLTGPLLLAAGIGLGFRLPVLFMANIVRVTGIILAVWGVAEFFYTYELYDLFSIKDFLHLKWVDHPDMIIENVRDAISFGNNSYLNLSGSFGLDIEILRPKGPSVHPITYGYLLAFCCLVCFIFRYYMVSLACFAMAVLVGAKGALLLAIMSIALSTYYGQNHNKKRLLFLVSSLLALYLVMGLIYGAISNDYHVIGFMGGVRGFLKNPLGRGVGVGGNISTMGVERTDFTSFQNFGADFALESALGVMLYQLGIGTIIFMVFYWRVAKSVWRAVTGPDADPRLIVAPIALAFLSINSVFQEEALSPCGWGLWFLLGGFLIANQWKRQISLLPAETS